MCCSPLHWAEGWFGTVAVISGTGTRWPWEAQGTVPTPVDLGTGDRQTFRVGEAIRQCENCWPR
jgi:hypothetical protein